MLKPDNAMWSEVFHGDFADGERPVIWIRGNDPRYSSLAQRWAAEKPSHKLPPPISSKYFKGDGWAFPAQWVGW